MNAITTKTNFTITDVAGSDIRYKAKAVKKKDVVRKFPLAMTDLSKTLIVYNPYNHESVLAAAILQQSYKEMKTASFEDLISGNMKNYIWIGVTPFAPTGYKQCPKNSVEYFYNSSQPAYSTPSVKKGILGLFSKTPSLSRVEERDNDLIEYVYGHTADDPVLDIGHISLIDKVMFDFCIENKNNWRRLSLLCKFWENDTLAEDEEAAFYFTLCDALQSLEQGNSFKTFYPSERNVLKYREVLADRYKVLSKKAAFYRVNTLNGVKKLAIISVSPEMGFIAARHFAKIDSKYLIMAQGMNGRLFTGNVRLSQGAILNDEIMYVD